MQIMNEKLVGAVQKALEDGLKPLQQLNNLPQLGGAQPEQRQHSNLQLGDMSNVSSDQQGQAMQLSSSNGSQGWSNHATGGNHMPTGDMSLLPDIPYDTNTALWVGMYMGQQRAMHMQRSKQQKQASFAWMNTPFQ